MRWFATVALILACLGGVDPASAHASLIGSDPASGAVLASSPSAIELTFSEPVSPLAANLVQPDGSTLKLEGLLVDGRTVSVPLPPATGPGTRVLSWRAVSSDGHPISGAVVFSIGIPSEMAPPPLPAADRFAAVGLWLARTITFVAVFIGVGGTAFVMIGVPQPRASRRLSLVLIACGVPAAIASIGLQGLDALGLSLAALADLQTWSVGFSTAYGATTAGQLLALLLGAAALAAKGPRSAAGLSALAISATAIAICLSGHASAAEPHWLSRAALFTHIVTITWWVGALFPLALLLKRERAISALPLIRFSRFIPFAIAPLVASGLILAIVQMGWPGPSWLTPYGALLAAKLMLLTALFAVASWNRWVLTAPAARGELNARTHMRRAILLEILLIVAILGLVSGWRFTPPPRVLAAAEMVQREPAIARLAKSGITADVVITPGRAGSVVVQIGLHRGDGTPLQAKSVIVSLDLPEAGIEAIKAVAVADGSGGWGISGFAIPLSGQWTLEIQVRVSDFELVRLRGKLAIKP
jgi:copper transport protein